MPILPLSTAASCPVDFSVLHGMTGGDAALEAELLEIFIESSIECLTGLRLSLDGGKNVAWREQAHAFKGIALNLGANGLGGLCRVAQEGYLAPPEDKRLMLRAIEAEMRRVDEAITLLRTDISAA